MSQRIFNLHNHTPFSDGAYTIDEIVEAHLDLKGISVEGVGISDHLFCTPSSREVRSEREFQRYFADETKSYVQAVHEARARWAGKMKVLCGVEINWPLNKNLLDYVRPLLTGVDYVLFEYLDWAGMTQLANQVRRFPCPVGLAHTDVSHQFPTTSMDQVVRTMANARVFYEVSTKFIPLNRHDAWFHILPQHKVWVSFGTDTHDDLTAIATLPKLVDYVNSHGLGERLFNPTLRAEREQNAPAATKTAQTQASPAA